MLKKIVIVIVVFLLVGTTSYFLHIFLLEEEVERFIPLLQKAYIFHFSFSLVLLLSFLVLAQFNKYFEQLGFIYMGLLVLKIIIFAGFFYPQLLGDNLLSRFYRASLLIPVIVFLPLEVIFISKILQGKKA
ncbi:DUF6168 family protein [Maribacter sp. ACAM166]|uniref:DUF6168 family protein n=1 Tax=Maribacter sp. ACAM166 TaxID=2508996 RepID=UPI0010FEA589|nr:DUF6168 family protein [Maribacter sp. ACAM166]TLP80782.1 hypothetical protein ES765_06930 [Maribacter sp. ACAM166]